MLSRVELLRTLPPQVFWPAPNVESALVRLTRDNRLGERAGAFGKFVQQIFSFRRKTLRKALSNAGFDAEAMLTATGHDGQLRPETFTPEQFLGMFDAAAAARVVS